MSVQHICGPSDINAVTPSAEANLTETLSEWIKNLRDTFIKIYQYLFGTNKNKTESMFKEIINNIENKLTIQNMFNFIKNCMAKYPYYESDNFTFHIKNNGKVITFAISHDGLREHMMTEHIELPNNSENDAALKAIIISYLWQSDDLPDRNTYKIDKNNLSPNNITFSREATENYHSLFDFYQKPRHFHKQINTQDLSFENQHKHHLMNKKEIKLNEKLKNYKLDDMPRNTKFERAIFELNCKIKNDVFIKSILSKCRNNTDVLRSTSNITEIKKCVYLMEKCGLSKKTKDEIKGYKHEFRDLYDTAIQVSRSKKQ